MSLNDGMLVIDPRVNADVGKEVWVEEINNSIQAWKRDRIRLQIVKIANSAFEGNGERLAQIDKEIENCTVALITLYNKLSEWENK